MTQQPWGPPQPGRQPWSGQFGSGQFGSGQSTAGQPAQQGGWQQPAAYGQPQGHARQAAWGQPTQQGTWGQPTQQGPWGSVSPTPPPPGRAGSPLRTLVLAVAVVLLFAAAGTMAFRLASQRSSAAPGSYQNDNYTPPPPDKDPSAGPAPDTVSEAEKWLTQNAAYQQSVPRPTRCEISQINLTTASKAQVSAHMDQLTGCLMVVWAKPLEAAGFTAVRPVSNVYSGKTSSPCGTLPSMNAVYCPVNQQIYYAMDLPNILAPALRTQKFVVESVIAHEFGHAVQYRTGMLASGQGLQQQASSAKNESLANEISRRLETQADCFSGMFLGSVAQSTGMSQSDLDVIDQVFGSIGDDVLTGKKDIEGNHGRAASRQYWGKMGMASVSIGACNTFTADESLVR